jgi:AraC-like DNA-binding protein
VHRAKTLLLTTDLNISQVAYEVGFRDPKYFNRSFNEVFGHSPKEVRKEK